MIEIDKVPSVPLFDDLFDSMVIHGSEGFAISKESLDRRECVSFGRGHSGKCTKYVLEGEPYSVSKSTAISEETFKQIGSLLEGRFKRNGMISADTLDGVSYLVKWISPRESIRLVISNPVELSVEVQEFVKQLEQVLSDRN